METLAYVDDPTEIADVQPAPWSRLHLVLFRFVFCFISLYTLDLLAYFFQRQKRALDGSYPKTFPESFTAPVWHHVIPWIGQHILHLAQPVRFHGLVGQDAPYEYILRGTQLALALIVALIWTLLDRHHRDYRSLDAYLRIFVRAGLASEMLFYGLAKAIPAQFGVLSLYRQAQPVGELWPMAMLWAFMAASPGYTMLCGLVETVGGLLLLTRRTVALGALVSLGAMVNVLALNVFYDVNQKIRCVYYVLLALYLAAPQLPGLWSLLVRQQAAAPRPEPKLPGPSAVRVVLSLVPAVFGVLLLVHFLPSDWYRYKLSQRTDAARGPNYGVWHVDAFNVADLRKPLLSGQVLTEMKLSPGQDRWRQLILDAGDDVYLKMGNGEYDHVEGKLDPQTGDTLFSDDGDASWHARLHFLRTSPTTMTAAGEVNGNPVTAAFTLSLAGTTHVTDAPRWVSDGRRW